MTADRALIADLKKKLKDAADPERAPGMQAYMKSEMPYLGVAATPLKALAREVFAAHPIEDEQRYHDTLLALWRGAKYREERYGAILLAEAKRYAKLRSPSILPVYEEIVVTGAWWDYVDAIATHGLGELMKKDPQAMKPVMRAWSKSDDMWKARSSILCQNQLKEALDLPLLYACIEPSIASKEFFLRKAIGWALRELAWRDPDEVIRYVKKRKSELSGLSKREALKNVLKSGKISAIP